MARDRLRNPDIQGVVVLDKPAGITSQQAVSRLRASMRIHKAGHGGTLDPFATGVLPVMVNSATRVASLMSTDIKVYRGVMRLGVRTDTLDPTGKVLEETPVEGLDQDKVVAALDSFLGEIEQVPPMYSAVKIKGKRLYELARKNIEVERKAKRVTIHHIEMLSMDLPDVEFRVRCSTGTYVRVLVDEVGNKLGCGAHLAALERETSGQFDIGNSITLDEIDELGNLFRDEESSHGDTEDGRRWRWPYDEGAHWWMEKLADSLMNVSSCVDAPTLQLNADVEGRVRHGEPVRAGDLTTADTLEFEAGDPVLLTMADGRTAAIMRATCAAGMTTRMPARAPVLEISKVLLPG